MTAADGVPEHPEKNGVVLEPKRLRKPAIIYIVMNCIKFSIKIPHQFKEKASM